MLATSATGKFGSSDCTAARTALTKRSGSESVLIVRYMCGEDVSLSFTVPCRCGTNNSGCGGCLKPECRTSPITPTIVKRGDVIGEDRKSTRLNSSHVSISYAVFCLKKKKKQTKVRAYA